MGFANCAVKGSKFSFCCVFLLIPSDSRSDMTQQGVIAFVSKGWSGHDKHPTKWCGIFFCIDIRYCGSTLQILWDSFVLKLMHSYSVID